MSLVPVSNPIDHLPALMDFSAQIARTEFVPSAMRGKPETVLACLAYGAEIGLGPMQSLSSVQVIDGKPTLSPEAMRALVLSAGHRMWIVEQTDTSVTLCGCRRGTEDVHKVTWTIAQAQTAGLANKDVWKKYPRAMLLARATSELCRAIFPDVVRGLSYTPEEIESIPAQSWSVDERRSELETAANGDGRESGGVVTESPAPAQPALASLEQRAAVSEALSLLDREMNDEVKARWKDTVGASFKAAERFTGDHADAALALIEEVRNDTYDRRRRHAMAVLADLGLTGKDNDEARHQFVKAATGDVESTAELTEAQLSAIVDAVEHEKAQRAQSQLPVDAA